MWLGPCKVIGTESSHNSNIPRVVWVSYIGYLYKCNPEGLRPVSEDEAELQKESLRQILNVQSMTCLIVVVYTMI